MDHEEANKVAQETEEVQEQEETLSLKKVAVKSLRVKVRTGTKAGGPIGSNGGCTSQWSAY